MSKNNKIYGHKIENNDIGNDATNKGNNIIDNSIIKNNNKIIPKGKNAKKKQVDKIEIRNKNLLPPQEEPSYENGKFACKLDELYSSALLNPEINDISFLRPNLELLYRKGIEVVMVAYVDAYRKRDEMVVLNNICTENLFLSDHILVNVDQEQAILDKIGQCVQFKGTVYKYGDKYSVIIRDVKDLESMGIRLLSHDTVFVSDEAINELFDYLNKKQFRDRLVITLASKLNVLSSHIFGADKFIIGMIFDFYYMRTRNKNLSNNNYTNDLIQSSHRFVAMFSDIIYRLETGKIKDFQSLRFRVLQLCMLTNPLPIDLEDLKNPKILVPLSRFCGENNIDMGYVLNNYIKSIYKRYKLRDVRASINSAQMLNEIKNAIINVASRI